MSKSLQAKVLENWYGIDNILFGSKQPGEVLSEDEFETYETTKASLLSNLYEIYKEIGFEPDCSHENMESLKEEAQANSVISLKRASELMEDEEVIKEISSSIKETIVSEGIEDKEDFAKYMANKNHKSIAIDCLTLESALSESCTACLQTIKGQLFIDSHKTLRDNLLDNII